MNAAESARDAAALHLWDEGIVRPESAAFAVVDFLVREGHMSLSSPPADDVREALLAVRDEIVRNDGRADAACLATLEILSSRAEVRPYGTVTDDKSLRSRIEQMVANQQSWIDAGRTDQVISRDAMRDALQKALDETDRPPAPPSPPADGVREAVLAIAKQMIPIKHEPLALQVASEWTDRIIAAVRPYGTVTETEVEAANTACGKGVPGTVPSWAGEDQIDPCGCVRPSGHEGSHACAHQSPSDAVVAAGEARS